MNFGMRMLTLDDLRNLGIRWSKAHLRRLEKAGQFPRRVFLSQRNIAWREDEIRAWLEMRYAARPADGRPVDAAERPLGEIA